MIFNSFIFTILICFCSILFFAQPKKHRPHKILRSAFFPMRKPQYSQHLFIITFSVSQKSFSRVIIRLLVQFFNNDNCAYVLGFFWLCFLFYSPVPTIELRLDQFLFHTFITWCIFSSALIYRLPLVTFLSLIFQLIQSRGGRSSFYSFISALKFHIQIVKLN